MASIIFEPTQKFLTTPIYPKGSPQSCYGGYPMAKTLAFKESVPVADVSISTMEKAVPFYWLLKSINFFMSGSVTGNPNYGASSMSASGTAIKQYGISPKSLICIPSGNLDLFLGQPSFMRPYLFGSTIVFQVYIDYIEVDPSDIGTTYGVLAAITNFSDDINDFGESTAFYEIIGRQYNLPFGIGSTSFYLHIVGIDGISQMSVDSFEITSFTFWNPIL